MEKSFIKWAPGQWAMRTHGSDYLKNYYTPCATMLLGGILVSVRPSVRPSVHPSFPHPVSALWQRTCFLLSALIGQSNQTCLKHLTLKHDNVNFRWDFQFRLCALNLLLINNFHDFVVCVESRCVINVNMSCYCVNSFDFALKKLHSHWSTRTIFPAWKSKKINAVARHVLLHSAYSSDWIHFIFIHLIKHLQKVCRV